MLIKKAAKNLLWFLVRFSGIPFLIRESIGRKRAAIIVYHNPTPDAFEKHIQYLAKRYNFITINALANALHTKDWSKIPPKPLIVTIDDGHKGNFALLPVFKKYNVTPTIYICSHIVNTNRHFWWKSGYSDFRELKNISNEEMLLFLWDEVDYLPEREFRDRQAMNKKEMKAMLPFVDFQSHTKFHPILPNCNDDECWEEIKTSKSSLEMLLGRSVEHFAYPNGDYGEREIQYLKRCGYRSARTKDWGWNTIRTDPLRMKNMNLNEKASINKLSAQVSGCYRLVQILGRRLGVAI